MLLNITEPALSGKEVLLSLVQFIQKTVSYLIHKLCPWPVERANIALIEFQMHPGNYTITQVLRYLCNFNYLLFICLESNYKVISIKLIKHGDV